MKHCIVVTILCLAVATIAVGQDKARVFITDSQSWEMRGGGGGGNGSWGGGASGGARPQTAEIIKTFGERCPNVTVNNIQTKADYVVVLDHEGGKGFIRKDNKVAVFERLSGDSIVSKSTMSLGGSVQTACEAITKHWSDNAARLRAESDKAEMMKAAPVAAASPELAKTTVPKVAVASTPDGADIEIDGSFVGNTPSTIELTAGEHVVVVKKSGYRAWQRKMKVSGGDIKLNAELEKE